MTETPSTCEDDAPLERLLFQTTVDFADDLRQQ